MSLYEQSLMTEIPETASAPTTFPVCKVCGDENFGARYHNQGKSEIANARNQTSASHTAKEFDVIVWITWLRLLSMHLYERKNGLKCGYIACYDLPTLPASPSTTVFSHRRRARNAHAA